MAKLLKKFTPGRGYSKEDWDVVSDNPELTDEELANLKSAREVLPPEFFEALEKRRRGQRGPQKTPTKIAVSIRLSRDVVDAFKAKGPGWQSRIDKALRASLRKAG
ncbi:MAG TPA: BrnA antitoxin family protein [Roseiarcus sp.]|nr:BrnA antitoxin family protein [Roseiarcus sp.]